MNIKYLVSIISLRTARGATRRILPPPAARNKESSRARELVVGDGARWVGGGGGGGRGGFVLAQVDTAPPLPTSECALSPFLQVAAVDMLGWVCIIFVCAARWMTTESPFLIRRGAHGAGEYLR
jgi:hypothetical protein